MSEKRCKTGGCWTKSNGDHTGFGCGCDCHQTLQVPTPDTKPVDGLGEATKKWFVNAYKFCGIVTVPDEDHEADDTIWTVSRNPNKTGWETDSSCSGYGLTKEDADELALAANNCSSLTQRVKVLEEALENIMKHQKIIGGSMAELSAVFKIAKEAIAEGDSNV